MAAPKKRKSAQPKVCVCQIVSSLCAFCRLHCTFYVMKVENTNKASGRLKKQPKTSKANSKEEKSVEVAQKDL